jgi:diguanylate cyclase (GGDEF)-like protein/putative nucleotidyltransferase with HDIG domain
MKSKLHLPSKSDINDVLNLEDKKLPVFPQVAAKLLKTFKDDTASMEELSQIVQTDPGLIVRILQITNSALFGLKRKITNLSEAMTFLGISEIKKLAFEMTVFDQLFKSGRSDEFDRLLFWRHCLSVAVLSKHIARQTNYHDPEEAYIAGLIHDIGKVFLDITGKKDYGKFILQIPTSTDQVIENERKLLGLGHDDIGGYLCDQWKLPQILISVVKYHHQAFGHLHLSKDENQLISIVSLANFLCWTQGIGSFDFIHTPILSPEVEKTLDFSSLNISGCITAMNDEIVKISNFYKFKFPDSDQLTENIHIANLKLSSANTQYYYQDEPMSTLISGYHKNRLGDIDFELGKSLARAKSLKEILDIVMYQIGRIFQPQNWSILLKDQKSSNLIFSLVVGVNKEKLQGAKLHIKEGIAGFIMETGESIVVEDVKLDDRFSIRVDNHTGFKTRSIIGAPLKSMGKIFGVIELVNRIDDGTFGDDDLDLLTSIAEYAAIAIERSYYHQALTNLATKDSITGLKNRWSFERAIRNKEDVLLNYGSIYSILIIDIQGLRQLEKDSEEIIKKLTQVMLQCKRREDDIYQYGENTFIIILPQTYAGDSDTAKNRLLKKFSLMVQENNKLRLKFKIFTHTLDSENTDQLKQIIATSLSKSIDPIEDASIPDMEYNIQDLFEKEKLKQANEKAKTNSFGKTVSLAGKFVRIKSGDSGKIRIERLSLLSIGFKILRSHRIKENDFLDLHFTLDNVKKDLVERRATVKSINANYVEADFYNPPPYAKNLGFYLMS